MAAMRSGTLGKTPRRSAFSVSSRNQRSTRFSQELAGGGEVQMKARMPGESGSDFGVLVGLVVVEDQMQVEPRRELAIEGAQEPQELLVAVARQALADDAAIESALGPIPVGSPRGVRRAPS